MHCTDVLHSPERIYSFQKGQKATNLNEHSKIDHYEGGGNKQFLPREKGQREQKRKGKAPGSTNPAVENDALVLDGEGESPELVADVKQGKHTWKGREVSAQGPRTAERNAAWLPRSLLPAQPGAPEFALPSRAAPGLCAPPAVQHSCLHLKLL